MVDSVDPDTAEVQRVDGLQHILITHCSREPGFITDRTTLVDAVFRVFLANSNEPLSVQELADKLNRSPEVIL
jgi:transcriptional regulator GlxA family with amidase domain